MNQKQYKPQQKVRIMKQLLLLILIGCTITGNVPNTIIPEETNLPTEVYFCQVDDCLAVLKQFENGSCAIYSSTLFSPKQLITKEQRKNGLMHNKFCVIDDKVATGSLNPTKTNIKEANNLIVIHSKYAAELFKEEYAELKNNVFGKGKRTKYPEIMLNNRKINIRFCPEDNCKKTTLQELKRAKKSIRFALNAFTDDDIGNLLKEKSEQIIVNGVLDSTQGQYSEMNKIKEFTKVIKNVHHKFFIIDEEIVITGSANPTRNGYYKNDENMLVLNDTEIAQKYGAEIQRLQLAGDIT